MFIVLDIIDGDKRVERMINTDYIVEIDQVGCRHSMYGYSSITLSSVIEGTNEVVYTDCKLAHIKEAMCGLVVMNEIKNYKPVVDIRTDCPEEVCECGHIADLHGSMGHCLMCKCDMFEADTYE